MIQIIQIQGNKVAVALLFAVATAFMVPGVGNAQITDGNAGDFGDFISALTDLINGFLIPFLIALAVLGFIYGVFQYFILGSDDEEKRGQGRSLMLYAIIGFVAIVALWGIVNFVADAFGFEQGAEAGKISGPSTQ